MMILLEGVPADERKYLIEANTMFDEIKQKNENVLHSSVNQH